MEVKSNLEGKAPLDGSVTNVKLAPMATKTYKGRTSAATGVPEDVAVATLKADLALTKADVGLGSADNTADSAKPVSTAQQTALDLKAPLASPTFTADAKTPPVDADSVMLMDSAAANILKKLTWANLKVTLKTYFDTLYAGSTIQALGVKNADFTVDIASGAYATVTTGTADVAMTLTSPASSTNSYRQTVAILQGATARVVTLKAADANVISSGGLMSSGDALPNSGANTLDVFEFQWTGTKWETYDARFDVKS